jgi:hypothetical protein
MSEVAFQIVEREPDDDYEYRVNGVCVGRANYDSHGSDGMSLARDMFEAIAKQLGVEVEE